MSLTPVIAELTKLKDSLIEQQLFEAAVEYKDLIHLCEIAEQPARINRVMQTVKGLGGNCLAACLSSILGVPLSSIPKLVPPPEQWKEGSHQTKLLRFYLSTLNLDYLEIRLENFQWTDCAVPDCPLLIAVKSNTPEVDAVGGGHFVVGRAKQEGNKVSIYVDHDPNGMKESYTAVAVGIIVPLKFNTT